MELTSYHSQSAIKFHVNEDDYPQHYYMGKSGDRLYVAMFIHSVTGDEPQATFDMDYNAFETKLDDLLDYSGSHPQITVPVLQWGDRSSLTFRYLDDRNETIIGPCGASYTITFEELDAIYGALPQL